MPILDDFRSLYVYTRWADGLTLDAVRQLTPEQYLQEPAPGWDPIRATLLHTAGATNIWARRLRGETVTVRPTEADFPTLDDIARYFVEGHDAFDRLVADLTPEALDSPWSYRDLKGDLHQTPLWAVYRHVANHATYHRGQVASKLKRFGVAPTATDFVYWAFAHTPQL